MIIRKAAVAGAFYPAKAKALRERIVAREAQRAEASQRGRDPSELFMGVVGLILLTAAIQPIFTVGLAGILATVYRVVLLLSRSGRQVRKAPWGAKALARTYVVCFLCVGVVLAVVPIVVFRLGPGVFE